MADTILSKTHSRVVLERKRFEPPPNELANGLQRGVSAAAILGPAISLSKTATAKTCLGQE